MRDIGLSVMLLSAQLDSTADRAPSTSAYTSSDPRHCQTIEESDEGAYLLQRCRGYQDIPLFVEIFDDRSDLSAGSAGHELCVRSIGCPFTSEGEKIEWRLRNGMAYAIIFRLHTAWPDESGKNVEGSVLIVETIGHAKRPGCRVAEIPGGKPNANALARAAADRTLTEKVKCLSAQ